MKFNIGDFFSYKTYWYILKDLSNIDTSDLILESDIDGNSPTITEDYFWSLWEDGNSGSNDLTIVETNIGNFIYHKIEDESVKEFLKQNSKNAPCGFFGSYRTVDNYKVAIAEAGEIKRFLSFEEGNATIEGNPTEFENQEEVKVGEDFESQLEFFDEDRVCRYAKWFVGFDYEQNDVEIKRIRCYASKHNEEDQTNNSRFTKKDGKTIKLYDPELPKDAKEKIIANLKEHGEKDVSIVIIKIRGQDRLIIGCKNINESPAKMICTIVAQDYKDEKDVINRLNACINAIIEENPKVDNKYAGVTCERLDYFWRKPNVDIVAVNVSIDRKFMFSAIKIQNNGKIRKPNLISVLLRGKIYYELNNYVVRDLYRLFIRKLK